MKISYKKLWLILIEKDIKKSDLRKITGISSGTFTKLNKNEPVALTILLTLCEKLDCDIGDICAAVEDDEIKKRSLIG